MNRSRRSAFASFLLYWVALGGASCAPSNDEAVGLRGPAAENAVYGVFPEVAPRWTEWPYRFEGARREGGREVFATPTSSLPKAISVEVPLSASEPVVVKGHDGFALRVWDEARRGTAELTASGLTYGRAGGGTSFWTARESGAEEWLFLPEGATSLEVARYRIEGGRPRQHDWAIDVYDDADRARITITAPQVFATDGQRVDAKMVLAGDMASVVLTRWVDGPLLVDPVFVSAGDMSGDRKWHDALLLSSGRVMVLGGYHQVGINLTDLATMELFDPSTGSWSNGPSASSPRVNPTLTILDDDRVLVVSETLSGPQPWTEIYDEQTNSWSTPAQSPYELYYHQAARLADGRVLVAGGSRVGTKAEVYDPSANTWTAVASLNKVHANQALILLPSHDVAIVGGATLEVYSTGTDAWTFLATPIYKNTAEGTTVLANGNIVTTGGTLVGSAIAWGLGTQLYDVAADVWILLASTSLRRDDVPVTLLKDESLLVAGGYNSINGTVFASSEVYSFPADAWTAGPSLIKARNAHTQTRLLDGRVVVAGGYDLSTSLSSVEVLTANQPNGAVCSSPLDCTSFFCVDGVCCESACAGSCMACAVGVGGALDGSCTAASNVACDDGDLCTTSDSCLQGLCSGIPKVCPGNPGECFGPDTCDPPTGSCVSNMLPNGAPCSIGTCSSGVCIDSGAGAGGSGGAGGDTNQGGNGGAQAGVGGSGGQPQGVGGHGVGGDGEGGAGASATGVGAGGTSSVTSNGTGSGAGLPDDETPHLDSGGCACRVGGTSDGSSVPRGALLLLGALLPLRRRSRTAPTSGKALRA